jgi:sec-independent protein translocase protein TatC
MFAYYLVFPLVFKFFAGVTPTGVTMMTDINQYLEFVLGLFFAFGFCFEIPIATFLIVSTGLTTTKSLTGKRPYVIVGCFIVACC